MTVQGSLLRIAHAVVVVLAVAAPPAAAEPPPAPAPAPAAGEPTETTAPSTPPGQPPASDELTPADVTGAPVPGTENGRTDPEDHDGTARRVLRGVLFLPRFLVNVVLSPLQLGLWAYDRYHLNDLYYRIFYNDARTIGVIPTASYETGFGLSVGARFVDTDLAGEAEQLWASAEGGGRYHQVYQAYVNSGDRFGDRLGLELYGQYEQRPKDVFYGIGNGDEAEHLPPAPVNPIVNPLAIETRFRQRIERVAGVINVRLIDLFYLRSSSELVDRIFSPGDYGRPIDEVYDTAALTGWGGVSHFYSELALRYDSRGRYNLFEAAPFYAMGSLAEVFGGLTHQFGDLPDYWRYGIDLQQFVRLAEGPRVLALRLRGEAVSGSRSEVPFAELPRLGGPDTLRGYPTDRFRDRVMAYGSAEYQWDLSAQVSAGVFVDVGRVYPSLDDLSVKHLRAGYGVALQLHGENSFWLEATLASSVDGGVETYLSFNPVYLITERVRRR